MLTHHPEKKHSPHLYSVSWIPIPDLPGIFSYDYAVPFYSVSCAVMTTVFGAKNPSAYLPSFTIVSIMFAATESDWSLAS